MLSPVIAPAVLPRYLSSHRLIRAHPRIIRAIRSMVGVEIDQLMGRLSTSPDAFRPGETDLLIRVRREPWQGKDWVIDLCRCRLPRGPPEFALSKPRTRTVTGGRRAWRRAFGVGKQIGDRGQDLFVSSCSPSPSFIHRVESSEPYPEESGLDLIEPRVAPDHLVGYRLAPCVRYSLTDVAILSSSVITIRHLRIHQGPWSEE